MVQEDYQNHQTALDIGKTYLRLEKKTRKEKKEKEQKIDKELPSVS